MSWTSLQYQTPVLLLHILMGQPPPFPFLVRMSFMDRPYLCSLSKASTIDAVLDDKEKSFPIIHDSVALWDRIDKQWELKEAVRGYLRKKYFRVLTLVDIVRLRHSRPPTPVCHDRKSSSGVP